MALGMNFARHPFRDYRLVYAAILLSGLLGILVFALNVRDYYAFQRQSGGTLSQISRLNASARQMEDEARQTRQRLAGMSLAKLQTESRQLNAVLAEKRFSWLLLLSHLEHVLPGDVYLTELAPAVRPDGTARLSLTCVGRGPDSIVRTLSAFSRDVHFSLAVPQSENQTGEGENAPPAARRASPARHPRFPRAARGSENERGSEEDVPLAVPAASGQSPYQFHLTVDYRPESRHS